jgi:Zn-finger nucleic acid-binding protein
MIILEFKDIELDFCVACQGCWMDRGELGLLLHGTPDLPDDFKLTGETKSKRRCPRCFHSMRAGILPGTDVEVDVCTDDGVWLDKGEAEAIAQARAESGHGAALVEFVSSVFGGGKRDYE